MVLRVYVSRHTSKCGHTRRELFMRTLGQPRAHTRPPVSSVSSFTSVSESRVLLLLRSTCGTCALARDAGAFLPAILPSCSIHCEAVSL